MIRTKLKLKDPDVVIEGRAEYLKHTRIITSEGIFFQAHEKHISNIISELGLMGRQSSQDSRLGFRGDHGALSTPG